MSYPSIQSPSSPHRVAPLGSKFRTLVHGVGGHGHGAAALTVVVAVFGSREEKISYGCRSGDLWLGIDGEM